MNAPQKVSATQPASMWFEVHPGLGISMMDHLFNRLDGAYPHKWRSNFPTQQAISNWCESWAEEFDDSGITPNDIKAGIKACRTRYDWPPSCAEFIKACKPAIDPLVAYYEAVAGVQARQAGETGLWSHAAIFWAAMPLAFDLANQTFSQVRTRWERALAEQMARGEWAPIPPPALALPGPGETPRREPLLRARAAELTRVLLAEQGGAVADVADVGDGCTHIEATAAHERHIDHLGWARKIIERERRGDRSVTAFLLRCAREALGIST